MERRPGRSVEPGGDGPTTVAGRALFSAGRFVGFAATGGTAVAILAAVVLVPEYARLAARIYERDCQAAQLADLQATVDAQDRLIAAMQDDQVLTKRMAMNQLGLLPTNEVVVIDADLPRGRPPGFVAPAPSPGPEPPSPRLTRLGARLEQPAKRRGLLLLAAGFMLAAMYLFSSPASRGAGPVGGG